MKRTSTHKPLAILLSLLMVLSAFSGMVFTASAEGAIAAIETTEYETLQDAVDAAQSGDTVTLLADADEYISVPYDKSLTLDLGGKTLTGAIELGYCDGNEGGYQAIFTLKNGTLNGIVDLTGSHDKANPATFILAADAVMKDSIYTNGNNCMNYEMAVDCECVDENYCPICNGEKCFVTIDIYGKILMEYPELDAVACGQAAIDENEDYAEFKEVSVFANVYDGAEVAGVLDSNNDYLGFNIYGGTVAAIETGSYCAGVNIEGGTVGYVHVSDNFVETPLTISGGTIEGDVTVDLAKSVDISGGTINGSVTIDRRADVTVSGGSFAYPISEDYLGNGFDMFKDEETGAYVVQIVYNKVEGTDATCGKDGVMTYYTDEAGAMYLLEDGRFVETNEEAIVIPATGKHTTTEIKNAKEATETEDGYTGDLVCTVCGQTISEGEVIPATGSSEPETPDEPADSTVGNPRLLSIIKAIVNFLKDMIIKVFPVAAKLFK